MDRLPGDTPEEQNRHLQELFHEVLGSDKGKVVLNVILNDLKYFSVCRTEQDNALRNYATVLVQERLGVFDTVSISDFIAGCKINGKESD